MKKNQFLRKFWTFFNIFHPQLIYFCSKISLLFDKKICEFAYISMPENWLADKNQLFLCLIKMDNVL